MRRFVCIADVIVERADHVKCRVIASDLQNPRKKPKHAPITFMNISSAPFGVSIIELIHANNFPSIADGSSVMLNARHYRDVRFKQNFYPFAKTLS